MPANPVSTVSRKSSRHIDPDHGAFARKLQVVTLSAILEQPFPYASGRVPASPGGLAAVPALCRPLRAELQLEPKIGRRRGRAGPIVSGDGYDGAGQRLGRPAVAAVRPRVGDGTTHRAR